MGRGLAPVEALRQALGEALEPEGTGPVLWRASLESPQGSERLGFASLADLFAYLENETITRSPGPDIAKPQGQ